MHQTFDFQHMAFLKGLQTKAPPEAPRFTSPPERFISIPTEPDESEDLMHNWKNFIEGGGDSTIDLIEGLNDAFISRQREQQEVNVASFIVLDDLEQDQALAEKAIRAHTTLANEKKETLGKGKTGMAEDKAQIKRNHQNK